MKSKHPMECGGLKRSTPPPRLPGNDGVSRLRAAKSGLSTPDYVTSDGAHGWSDGGVDWSSVQLNKQVGRGTHLRH